MPPSVLCTPCKTREQVSFGLLHHRLPQRRILNVISLKENKILPAELANNSLDSRNEFVAVRSWNNGLDFFDEKSKLTRNREETDSEYPDAPIEVTRGQFEV